MELVDALKQSIEDLPKFKHFISESLNEDPQFLQRVFGIDNGNLTTVLNYLILTHHQENHNLTGYIEYLLKLDTDAFSSQPIHFAFKHKKLDLIPLLLDALPNCSSEGDDTPSSKQPELNSRDANGRTLISRAIEAGNTQALRELLAKHPNIDQPSRGLQPIHQAVLMNFAEGVEALLDNNAKVNNPCRKQKETPLLLAAHHGKIDALRVLLARTKSEPNVQNPFDIQNGQSLRAIDLLCKRLQAKHAPLDSIRGIAMLLANGASAPRLEKFRTLLQDNRLALLDAVSTYIEEMPHLSVNLVRAGHDKNNPLHTIFYADKTWRKSVGHFFGRPDRAAFKLEKIIVQSQETMGSASDKDSYERFNKNEIRFAEFVRRYDLAIKKSCFYNPWSEMRWKITRGEITTWGDVLNYVKEHPDSRSRKIINEMRHHKTAADENLNRDDDPQLSI